MLVCLCLLASAASLFSSCSAKQTVLDFEQYVVIYPNATSDRYYEEIRSFYKYFGEKLGIKLRGKTEILLEPTEYEILIGNTNRPESEEALKKISGNGYAITDRKSVV